MLDRIRDLGEEEYNELMDMVRKTPIRVEQDGKYWLSERGRNYA